MARVSISVWIFLDYLLTSSSGVAVLQRALELKELQFSSGDSTDVTNSYGVVTTGKYTASSLVSDALKIGPSEKGILANFAYEVSQHRNWKRELDGLASKVAF